MTNINGFYKMLRENKGFSLVELMIALLIMVIIAGTAVTLFINVLETSKSGADRETAAFIERALRNYISASNDVDLSCLGITTGDNSTDVIDALSKKTVIAASDATNGETETLWSNGDMSGNYGPFLNSSDIKPTQKGRAGWKIEYNAVSQTITVTSVEVDADATIIIN